MRFSGERWNSARVLEKVRGQAVSDLELFDTAVDDELLTTISREGALKSLHLSSDIVTDDGVIAIVEQCALRSLLLSGVPNVSDRAMGFIARCATLCELYLEGTTVSDGSIGKVSQLPELWSLNISDTGVTDVGISRIASRTIGLLSFEHCRIEGTGISTWRIGEKMSIYGEGSRLTDEGFAVACASFTRMWNVIVSNTDVGDEGIKALAGQSPTMLRIDGTRVTKNGVRWIVEHLPVEELQVNSAQMTEPEAEAYPKPRTLTIYVVD